MRSFIYAAAAALVLAACGQGAPGASGSAGPAAAAGGVFPDLFSASYRAEGMIRRPGGDATQQMPVVQLRAGKLMRMEISEPSSGMQTATIVNGETQEAYTLTNIGGRQVAMRIALDQAGMAPGMNFDPASVTRVGACSGAGESGTEWTNTDAEGHVTNTCVTSDGIMLRSARDGQVYWETTRVQRGPQDPALFTLPAGVQVMDLNAAAGQMAGQMQQLREKMGQ